MTRQGKSKVEQSFATVVNASRMVWEQGRQNRRKNNFGGPWAESQSVRAAKTISANSSKLSSASSSAKSGIRPRRRRILHPTGLNSPPRPDIYYKVLFTAFVTLPNVWFHQKPSDRVLTNLLIVAASPTTLTSTQGVSRRNWWANDVHAFIINHAMNVNSQCFANSDGKANNWLRETTADGINSKG